MVTCGEVAPVLEIVAPISTSSLLSIVIAVLVALSSIPVDEKDAVQVWQEGEELPEGVSVGDNKLDENGNTIPKYQGIDQSKLVPLLVKTIQELEARITTLENA